ARSRAAPRAVGRGVGRPRGAHARRGAPRQDRDPAPRGRPAAVPARRAVRAEGLRLPTDGGAVPALRHARGPRNPPRAQPLLVPGLPACRRLSADAHRVGSTHTSRNVRRPHAVCVSYQSPPPPPPPQSPPPPKSPPPPQSPPPWSPPSPPWSPAPGSPWSSAPW